MGLKGFLEEGQMDPDGELGSEGMCGSVFLPPVDGVIGVHWGISHWLPLRLHDHHALIFPFLRTNEKFVVNHLRLKPILV